MGTRLRQPAPLTLHTSHSNLHVPLSPSPSPSRPTTPLSSIFRKNSYSDLSTMASDKSKTISSKKSYPNMLSPISPNGQQTRPHSIRRFFSKMSMNSAYKENDGSSVSSSSLSTRTKSRPTTAQSIYMDNAEMDKMPTPVEESKFVLPSLARISTSRSSQRLGSAYTHSEHERGFDDHDENDDFLVRPIKRSVEPPPTLPDLPKQDLTFDVDSMFSFLT